MLDTVSRATLVMSSALCLAGAFALAPSGARGSIDTLGMRPAAWNGRVFSAGPAFAMLTRDPFDEPTSGLAPSVAQPASALASGPQTSAIGPLPSNLATDTIPAIPDSGADTSLASARVTAIVTGAHPYALVELGGVHAIDGIGDRIAGQSISAIDIDGIRLHNGTRLTVDAGGRP
jgi:hypothetical protein